MTWNLGSNTAAVGGSVITSGYTAGVYGLRGDNTTTFQKYDLGTGTLVGEGEHARERRQGRRAHH